MRRPSGGASPPAPQVPSAPTHGPFRMTIRSSQSFRKNKKNQKKEESATAIHSYASASIGSLCAAFNAGYNAPASAPTVAITVARNTHVLLQKSRRTGFSN